MPEVGKADEEEFASSVALVRAAVQGLDIPQKHKTRFNGSLDSMNSKRAKDVLHELAKKGLVRKAQVDAWDKLRNHVAHGTSVSDTEELLRLLESVTGLFNCLVFVAIGYAGPFTDYTLPGRPTVMYPDAIRFPQVAE